MSSVIHVILEAPAFPDLASQKGTDELIDFKGPWTLAGLRGGTVEGRATVFLRLDLPDGRTLLAETTLRALYSALRIITEAMGEPWMR